MQPIALKILIGLHRNVNNLDRTTAKLAAQSGLTYSQFMVLEALYSKGDMTVGEVRDKILSSVGTIPLIVNNLVKMGCIERQSIPEDRRVSLLHLTEYGREVIEKVIPANTAMIEAYMSVLNEDEQELLLELLKKIGGRLK